jgi:hypothetical protein
MSRRIVEGKTCIGVSGILQSGLTSFCSPLQGPATNEGAFIKTFGNVNWTDLLPHPIVFYQVTVSLA